MADQLLNIVDLDTFGPKVQADDDNNQSLTNLLPFLIQHKKQEAHNENLHNSNKYKLQNVSKIFIIQKIFKK